MNNDEYKDEEDRANSLTAADLMTIGAQTYRERNAAYGDNYKQHGFIMDALFPKGINLVTVQDHNRFGIITMLAAKLCRYCNNFEKGGHKDSIHDLGVYAFMLQELDQ